MTRKNASSSIKAPGTHLPKPSYSSLLGEIKSRIRVAQTRVTAAVNAELIALYWEVGKPITDLQSTEGWGAGVIGRLASDLRNEVSEVKGFSERNLKLMTQFYREYSNPASIGQPPVAQLPWAHNVILLQKVKDQENRRWYAQKAVELGWSRNVLTAMIQGEVHRRQGKALTNFAGKLTQPQSDLAQETLKDPYVFDFLTLAEPFHERELETGLLRHVEKFLLELGTGFAFVGRQCRIEVGGEDFYIDLLFYHFVLRCFVVIDLKKGAFKAEYAGKMNFYCNLVEDRLRQPADNTTIGLILCQSRNRLVAEYALRGVTKAIGVSEYQITRALPKSLQSSLPSVEQIEAELDEPIAAPPTAKRK